MRIALKFGSTGPIRYMGWWNPVSAFPVLVRYAGKKWEFVLYDDDSSKIADKVFFFSEVSSYDPNYNATTYQEIEHLMDKLIGLKCECGKEKHGFTSHLDWCPKGQK